MLGGKLIKYEGYIFIGLLMVIGTLAKLFNFMDFSSDWFWFVAGIALVFEGILHLSKQKQFNKKYKVISKQEFNELWERLEEAKKKK